MKGIGPAVVGTGNQGIYRRYALEFNMEEIRDRWYEKLGREFAEFGKSLDDEGRVSLDGLLWKTATEIAEEKACGTEPAAVHSS